MIKKVSIRMTDSKFESLDLYNLPDEFENELIYRFNNRELMSLPASEGRTSYINLQYAREITIERY
ncbi:hypothetical protein [Streptococcus pluranimalium]|uniref:hypothetical protein n=1 Tax=Streptococcus pluranimalium TaxID=82348 RepID=UPI004046AA66